MFLYRHPSIIYLNLFFPFLLIYLPSTPSKHCGLTLLPISIHFLSQLVPHSGLHGVAGACPSHLRVKAGCSLYKSPVYHRAHITRHRTLLQPEIPKKIKGRHLFWFQSEGSLQKYRHPSQGQDWKKPLKGLILNKIHLPTCLTTIFVSDLSVICPEMRKAHPSLLLLGVGCKNTVLGISPW